MGLGFSFFKPPKHRVFHYQPLYYDEQKEAMKERLEQLEEEKGNKKEYRPGRFIRMNMRKALYENRRQSGNPFVTRVIVLCAILGLLIMIYYVAQYFGFFFK